MRVLVCVNEASSKEWKMAFAEKFDVIFSHTVLLHLTEDHLWEKALDNIAACMHDTSVLLLWEYISEQPLRDGAVHVRHRPMSRYASAFKARGLFFDHAKTQCLQNEGAWLAWLISAKVKVWREKQRHLVSKRPR